MRISGVRGELPRPTPSRSRSAIENGYKADRAAHGRRTRRRREGAVSASNVVFERLALDGVSFEPEQITTELVGTGVCHQGITSPPSEPAELILKIGVRDQDAAKVNRFGSEIVPLVTSGPPGVTGFAGGRPKAQAVIGYWPALMRKGKVATQVTVRES